MEGVPSAGPMAAEPHQPLRLGAMGRSLPDRLPSQQLAIGASRRVASGGGGRAHRRQSLAPARRMGLGACPRFPSAGLIPACRPPQRPGGPRHPIPSRPGRRGGAVRLPPVVLGRRGGTRAPPLAPPAPAPAAQALGRGRRPRVVANWGRLAGWGAAQSGWTHSAACGSAAMREHRRRAFPPPHSPCGCNPHSLICL